MSSRRSQQAKAPAPAKEIARVAGPRPLRDRVAEALRDMAVADGALTGKYAELSELAKERWRVRADVFVERAAKQKVSVSDESDPRPHAVGAGAKEA